MYRDTENLPVREIESEEARAFRAYAKAIRRGCELVPLQAFDTYFKDADGDDCNPSAAVSACAWGAAMIAGEPNHLADKLAIGHGSPCPAIGCDWGKFIGAGTIPHLNDDHRWTREAIADWLDAEAAAK